MIGNRINKPTSGWLEIISGTMFSGKSEELLRRLKRVVYAKKKCLLFKPSLDNRYAENEVVTHGGVRMPCIAVNHSKEMLNFITPDIEYVGIDEIQFFQTKTENRFDIELVIEQLLEQGIIVIGAGLDRYSTGAPFGPMPFLMSMAKYVDKYHAVCVGLTEQGCGAKSYISYKIGSDQIANHQNSVALGAFGEYVPLCENCWKMMKRQKEEILEEQVV